MIFEFWFMLPVAILIATIAMGSGVEGATFFSPFFMIVLGLDAVTAIGTGLITEVFGFGSGLYAYYRRGAIDYQMGGQLLLVTVPAALFGVWVAHFVPADILKAILGMGLVIVAISFLRTPDDELEQQLDARAHQPTGHAERCLVTADGKQHCYTVFNRAEGLLTGGIGGTFIGMLSTGLGELNGYLLLQRCRIPSTIAIATSVFVVAITALAASVTHAVQLAAADAEAFQQVLRILLFTIPGVLVGGQLGPAVAARIPDETLERGMGVLFLLVAAIVIADAALM